MVKDCLNTIYELVLKRMKLDFQIVSISIFLM